ncbi:efflux RND transporter permease subunit, partial [Salmonella sp. NW527]|uniref:efflux RND transporter permease subunit n=1 Tax=Salmonella sp. NW527 TaxID=2948065 RepID=UPI003F4429F4
MDFSRFFIDRPIFAAVLSILIFITGLIAIPLLPVSEYPDVVPPSVQVRAEYPGANPKVIAETVATPLEEAINGVENMMYMKWHCCKVSDEAAFCLIQRPYISKTLLT